MHMHINLKGYLLGVQDWSRFVGMKMEASCLVFPRAHVGEHVYGRACCWILVKSGGSNSIESTLDITE